MSEKPESEDQHGITLGMVGLGRMGANISLRAMRAGHTVIGFDRDNSLATGLNTAGVTTTKTLEDLVGQLPVPRTVWVMVPAGEPTHAVITQLRELLSPGDCIIDGGNSYYKDDISHAIELQSAGIEFIDVGTSGGVWGLERGYSLMIGGNQGPIMNLSSLWNALAPGIQSSPRTITESQITPAEEGWLHCGPHGAGHFVKMVHNGIEYALMSAYAEGFNILKHANAGSAVPAVNAALTPSTELEPANYNFNVAEIAEVWRRGSVIGSWLLDLTAAELRRDPELHEFEGQVSDSGEGRWTSITAIEEGVPAPVLTASLYSRFTSRGQDIYANKILSAMRKGFGGHIEK